MNSENDNLIISAESPQDSECLDLLARLRTELGEKYPDELVDTALVPEDLTVESAAFLMARRNGQPVGCGAIRPHAPGVAEVKRMFVVQEARGYGVGRAILENLETFRKEFRLQINATRNWSQTTRGNWPVRIRRLSSHTLLRSVPGKPYECLF